MRPHLYTGEGFYIKPSNPPIDDCQQAHQPLVGLKQIKVKLSSDFTDKLPFTEEAVVCLNKQSHSK